MEFIWDENKRRKVLAAHKIDFLKIQDIFDDPFAFYFEDFEHSGETEIRRAIVGKTSFYGLIVLIFIYEDEQIKFITARRAEKWMVNEYEDQRNRF